jgi:hypothetical protein
MRMKNRWTAVLILAAALMLGASACRAPNEGGQESTPTPATTESSEAAPTESETEGEDASPTDSDGGMVDY